MSIYNSSSNNIYQIDLNQISSNPQIQQLALKHLKNSGSIHGIHNSVYGQSSNNNNSSGYYNNGSVTPSAGSNGTYMYHCYYGTQPGNKITTVIG